MLYDDYMKQNKRTETRVSVRRMNMKIKTLFLELFDPRAGFTLFAVHVSPLWGSLCF